MPEKDSTIWVETLVSHRTKEPLVQIAWHDHTGQLTPQQTRELAMNLLNAAAVAESDAFISAFVQDKIGADENAAAGILVEFRNYRETLE